MKMENGIEVKFGWIVRLSRYSSIVSNIVEYFGKLDMNINEGDAMISFDYLR